MMTVKEVSRRSGVSVRTLHHYDSIGLLKPTAVTEAGYRLYDEGALRRLGQILLLRELQFSLKQITEILDSPAFDPAEALKQQIRLLEMEKERLDRILNLARGLQEKGEFRMKFDAFDRSELEEYKEEARRRWGGSDAFRAYEAQDAGKTDEVRQGESDGLMAVFAEMGKLRSKNPESAEAQALVATLQAYISEHYYPCSDEILAGLGQMYVADDRFRKNIDEAGGEGTAIFAGKAIAVYCKGEK